MILAVSVALVMVDLTSLILRGGFVSIFVQLLKVSSVKLSQPLASYCSLLLPKLGQVPFRVLDTIQVVLTVSHQHQNSTGLRFILCQLDFPRCLFLICCRLFKGFYQAGRVPFVPIGIPLDPLEPLIDMNLLGSNLPRRLSSVRRRRSSKSPLCQEQLALSPFLDPLHKSKGSRHTADCTKLCKPRMSSHPLKANPLKKCYQA